MEPNPISWLMFAYGTTFLVMIEAGLGATWRELMLPVFCAISSIAVAVLAWRNRKGVVSLTMYDWWTFRIDVMLTIAYIALWTLLWSGVIGADYRDTVLAALLAGISATTLTAFMPLIRSAFRNPASEHPAPWFVWSIAYAALLLTTVLDLPETNAAPLLVYPAISFSLHALVAILAVPGMEVRRE